MATNKGGEVRKIGAHVSVQDGVSHAPGRAQQLQANAMAMFVKSQRRWRDKPLNVQEAIAFKERLDAAGIAPSDVLVHSGYLINLGSPSSEVRQNSITALIDELRRCAQLSLSKLVLHPGSHLRQLTETECMKLIARGLHQAISETEGSVRVLLENTAGQGSNLGYNFEQLAYIIEQVECEIGGAQMRAAPYLGVCLDTCHLWASGYDLADEEGYLTTWQQFSQIIGWSRLQGMHINDSKGACGSRLDRHAELGAGTMGKSVFCKLLKNEHLAAVPWILETPNSERWAQEIDWLRTHG